jgi:glycosyltransferase involved in cell wall biosynthesis
MSRPEVSVLITTYNRAHLLTRAIESVRKQDFRDFEIVVIDDASSDATPEAMRRYESDPRIRYVRNATNVGGISGDRAHIRRFVYELARGRYFIYLCDDDYWLRSNLLSRLVAAHRADPELAMAQGGQLSFFVGDDEAAPEIRESDLDTYLNPDFSAKGSRVNFHSGVFPAGTTPSARYLERFADAPATCNIIGGANLYDRERFVRSGAIASEVGSKWQAGFELVMGPGCYGNHHYIDEPCIVTEIRAKNASFGRTQAEHFQDSVFSIELAFRKPLADAASPARRRFLRHIRARTILNLGRAYLSNTLQIKRHGTLGLCTPENMSVPVTWRHLAPAFLRNGVRPRRLDVKALALTALSPALLKKWDSYRGR